MRSWKCNLNLNLMWTFIKGPFFDQPGPNYLKRLTPMIKNRAPKSKGGFNLFLIP